MCAIVGVLNFNRSQIVSRDLLNAMRDTMAHRGPDGCGSWVSEDGVIGLGHRRLSIIDLSETAAQPMTNEDKSIWITFNGEIYNHQEIRDELSKYGNHVWTTNHSDTEVIVHAYEQWGVDCVKKFRGMFAIGIWDSRIRKLWLIRDRLGVKPLYYSFYDNKIAFASEIKALLADPTQERSVDEESFFHYLSFLTTPAPRTLFNGINKLESGCWLCVSDSGEKHQHRYWDVLDNLEDLEGLSENEISDRLRDELRTAVKLRKVSDVPIGVFLSGGIDSSTNAALFSEGERRSIKTFSIGYQGVYESCKDELQYAKQVAESVNAEYYDKRLSVDDLVEFLPKMVHLQDEPIADPVCVPVYYLSKLARENGVIVCQVGEGADELFWGYPHWKMMLGLQNLDDLPIPTAFKKAVLYCLELCKKTETRPFEWLRRGTVAQPIFWGGAEAFTEGQKQKILSRRLRKKFEGRTSWDAIKPIRERFMEKCGNKDNLKWMTYLDLNFRLPELLLMRVDKMSMGVGLEGRVPFLDYKFVEYSMSIPSKLKTKRGVLKYILKKAVRGVIPDNIINRKKQGFSVPVYEWFFDKLGNKTRDELEQFCARTDFLDRDEVMRLIEEGRGPEIWHLLNFAIWWKQYIA
jgi:asparagine synthase (glutamine-hydrolysing)